MDVINLGQKTDLIKEHWDNGEFKNWLSAIYHISSVGILSYLAWIHDNKIVSIIFILIFLLLNVAPDGD